MSGTLWRGRSDNTFDPIRLIPPDILSLIGQERYDIYQDSRGIIWISTFGNGLFAIDDKEEKIYHYTSEKDLSTNYLFCVTEDKSGEIWLGTELAGAIKISLTNYPFEIFYPNTKKNTERNNAVRLIYEDSEGKYWFGMRNGSLIVYDPLLNKQYTHQILSQGLAFTMAEDTLGYKWLGTKGGGLMIFSPKGDNPQTYQLHNTENQSSSSNNIFTVMRDAKGRMWIASFGGGLHLAERDNNELSFRQMNMINGSQNMMRSMIQDQKGLIWVGSNDGVILFDPDEILEDEKRYINLHLDEKNKQSLNNKEVRVIFEDSKK